MQNDIMICDYYILLISNDIQIATPWADRTASISEGAINLGEAFIYNFIANKVKAISLYHNFTYCFSYIFSIYSIESWCDTKYSLHICQQLHWLGQIRTLKWKIKISNFKRLNARQLQSVTISETPIFEEWGPNS